MSIEDTKKGGLSRRAMLMKLGLAATAAYAAPVMLKLDVAHASGGSGGGSGGGRGGRGGNGGRGSGARGNFGGRNTRRARTGSFSGLARRFGLRRRKFT